MSQQAAAGRGGGRKPRYFPRKGGGNFTATAKAYESPITVIAKYTFNMGENKFAAQFTESRERVTGYIQRSGMDGCYLVAKTIRTRTGQTIALPAAVDVNALDKADLEVICVEVVKSVAKRRQKLEESLKKGYAIVYDQCSQESTNINVPYRGDPNDTGVAFLQCGGTRRQRRPRRRSRPRSQERRRQLWQRNGSWRRCQRDDWAYGRQDREDQQQGRVPLLQFRFPKSLGI